MDNMLITIFVRKNNYDSNCFSWGRCELPIKILGLRILDLKIYYSNNYNIYVTKIICIYNICVSWHCINEVGQEYIHMYIYLYYIIYYKLHIFLHKFISFILFFLFYLLFDTGKYVILIWKNLWIKLLVDKMIMNKIIFYK